MKEGTNTISAKRGAKGFQLNNALFSQQQGHLLLHSFGFTGRGLGKVVARRGIQDAPTSIHQNAALAVQRSTTHFH